MTYLFVWLCLVPVAACRTFAAVRGLSPFVEHRLQECTDSVVGSHWVVAPTAYGLLVPCPGIEPTSPT